VRGLETGVQKRLLQNGRQTRNENGRRSLMAVGGCLLNARDVISSRTVTPGGLRTMINAADTARPSKADWKADGPPAQAELASDFRRAGIPRDHPLQMEEDVAVTGGVVPASEEDPRRPGACRQVHGGAGDRLSLNAPLEAHAMLAGAGAVFFEAGGALAPAAQDANASRC